MNQRIGLVAGYGKLPEVFVQELVSSYKQKIVPSVELYIAGIKNYTSKKIFHFAKHYEIFDLVHLYEIINFFKNWNVTNVVLLGVVPHKLLAKDKLMFDTATNEMFSKMKTYSAMEIFSVILEEFRKANIVIDPIDKYLPHLFADKGMMTSGELTQEDLENINYGYNIAKTISLSDIGLTVVVKNKIVVAVEALEGTDECILRGSKLAGPECYVIKVARPNQDMKFDLPVIGPKTVKILHLAKVKLLAVESKKTLIIDKPEVIKKMDKLAIKLYGI